MGTEGVGKGAIHGVYSFATQADFEKKLKSQVVDAKSSTDSSVILAGQKAQEILGKSPQEIQHHFELAQNAEALTLLNRGIQSLSLGEKSDKNAVFTNTLASRNMQVIKSKATSAEIVIDNNKYEYLGKGSIKAKDYGTFSYVRVKDIKTGKIGVVIAAPSEGLKTSQREMIQKFAEFLNVRGSGKPYDFILLESTHLKKASGIRGLLAKLGFGSKYDIQTKNTSIPGFDPMRVISSSGNKVMNVADKCFAKGVKEKDFGKQVEQYKKAAKLGHTVALDTLLKLLDKEKMHQKIAENLGFEREFRKEIESYKDPIALYELGCRLPRTGKDNNPNPQWIKCFKKASDGGHLGAKLALAEHYMSQYDPRAVPAQIVNLRNAEEFYRSAAELGSSKAAIELLKLHLDHSEALQEKKINLSAELLGKYAKITAEYDPTIHSRLIPVYQAKITAMNSEIEQSLNAGSKLPAEAAKLYFNLGNSQLEIGDVDKALESYKKAAATTDVQVANHSEAQRQKLSEESTYVSYALRAIAREKPELLKALNERDQLLDKERKLQEKLNETMREEVGEDDYYINQRSIVGLNNLLEKLTEDRRKAEETIAQYEPIAKKEFLSKKLGSS